MNNLSETLAVVLKGTVQQDDRPSGFFHQSSSLTDQRVKYFQFWSQFQIMNQCFKGTVS